MRITASVAGFFLMAAVAVAQDDSNAVAAVAQNGDIAAESVAQNGNNAAAVGAIVMDDAAIAAQVKDLQKHVAIARFSDKTAANKKGGGTSKTVWIETEQDKDDPFAGTMRLTVEMLDGTNMWYSQQMQTQVKQKLLSSTEKKAADKAKAEKKKGKGKKTGGKEKKTEVVETKAAETEAVETEAAETKAVETKAVETKAVKLKASEIDYTGEDSWKLIIQLGKDGAPLKPETTAYAAEYGFVVNRKADDGTVVSNQFVVVASKYKKVASADEIMVRNQGSKVLKAKMTGKAKKEGEGDNEGGEGGEGGGNK